MIIICHFVYLQLCLKFMDTEQFQRQVEFLVHLNDIMECLSCIIYNSIINDLALFRIAGFATSNSSVSFFRPIVDDHNRSPNLLVKIRTFRVGKIIRKLVNFGH